MTSPISFCFVGEQGSGKSLICGYLKKKFPDAIVIKSGPLWDEIAGRPLTHYERTVIQKGIVDEHGEQYFVDFIMKKIKDARSENPDSRFIVDGIRSKEVLQALRKYFGCSMMFVGVVTEDEKRIDRLVARDGGENTKDRDEKDRSQFDIQGLVRSCENKLINDFDNQEQLFKEVDILVEKKDSS